MSAQSSASAARKKKVDWTKLIGLVAGLVALVAPMMIEVPGLSVEGQRVFGIFLLAVVFWVTEAIPLHATAAVIIFLEILFISDKAVMPLPEGVSPAKYTAFYHALAHPVLMLFLGGFFLADGAAKYNLDRNLARVLLRPFGSSPPRIMLGLMLITATLSMFMSNTATTATMMAVVLPVMLGLPAGDRMKVGLALCIPVAANVGGIGTPVGTPPNAIALGALSQMNVSISFVKWMIMAVPGMIVVLLAAWVILTRLYPSSQKEIELKIEDRFNTSRPAIIFYLTAALTIGLWLTEPLHHMKSTVVGFIPVVVLLSTRVFSTKDMQSIQWHVLWLVAGGIALGVGVGHSGFDTWLIGLVKWEAMGPGVIAIALALVSLLMSTVISNSATANLLIPVGLSLATSGAVSISPLFTGFFIAIGASLAMALPISTPPNAIAYSTGSIRTRDMALVGVLVGGIGIVVFLKLSPLLWGLMGVMPR